MYPKITAFQSMMLLSWGAPLIPAGGSCCSLLKSLISLFLAGVDIQCPLYISREREGEGGSGKIYEREERRENIYFCCVICFLFSLTSQAGPRAVRHCLYKGKLHIIPSKYWVVPILPSDVLLQIGWKILLTSWLKLRKKLYIMVHIENISNIK